MSTKIFINLPVKDLKRTKAFFAALGFSFNPQFTDEKAACLVVSEEIYAMLATEPLFKTFAGHKDICDAAKCAEALVALTVESRAKVDEMAEKVIAAGGKEHRPAEDHGWMYGKSFEDPDGHIWEFFWMDPAHVQKS